MAPWNIGQSCKRGWFHVLNVASVDPYILELPALAKQSFIPHSWDSSSFVPKEFAPQTHMSFTYLFHPFPSVPQSQHPPHLPTPYPYPPPLPFRFFLPSRPGFSSQISLSASPSAAPRDEKTVTEEKTVTFAASSGAPCRSGIVQASSTQEAPTWVVVGLRRSTDQVARKRPPYDISRSVCPRSGSRYGESWCEMGQER